MTQDRIVRERERKSLTGIGRITWTRMERAGHAPKRRLLTAGGNRICWLYSELQEWIKSRPEAISA
jgi:prophage regulatory protein